eukprot:CAMPEP_0197931388 /NCGR_PEP_ID=MMETSP1439-20131203/107004_1 /TAXON_ID=66791 /ORGANISM="Gonyaulax spinifera, Strain CCMP409" /LENGTH=66 /DNA_ID=CAMNT_0043554123 /DNA_START=866 /DNA_END=1066 /DNA_ORIENTATION=-
MTHTSAQMTGCTAPALDENARHFLEKKSMKAVKPRSTARLEHNIHLCSTLKCEPSSCLAKNSTCNV